MSAGEPTPWAIRDYRDEDEASWLRCRVLSFLGSAYYDDVVTRRTAFAGEAIRLVAVRRRGSPEEVVGVMDVELWDDEAGDKDLGDDNPGDKDPAGALVRRATIDTVAVHPDHERRGIAGSLLAEALRRLAGSGAVSLDAWTREDEAANGWYRQHDFTEQTAYLHVYKGPADPDEGFTTPTGLSAPVTAFCHARLGDEVELRRRFTRVHVCRQYLRPLERCAAAGR